MSKIVIVSSYALSLTNFRSELIKTLAEAGHRVIALGPESGFDKKLASLGAEYRQFPLRRTKLNPARDLVTFISLVRLFRKVKPDMVFAYTIKPVVYGSLAASLAGVPEIFAMITGLGSSFNDRSGSGRSLLYKMIRYLYRKALKKNRLVFFQNPDDLELFRSEKIIGPDARTALVNGSGVDLVRFSYVEPRKGPVSFLLMGRLIRDKGIVEYVEAARILKSRYPDTRFRLAGFVDVNPTAIRKKQLDSWVEEGVIDYLGEKEDVRPFLADAGVYVLPSYREGTPRSVLEAMAVGRPVITTDAPGCRETVRDGENGFLVPVGDSAALAVAMERFILNPALVLEMGRKSREIAVVKYDVHKVNRVMIEAMGLDG